MNIRFLLSFSVRKVMPNRFIATIESDPKINEFSEPSLIIAPSARRVHGNK